jgi:hypothetical protein
MALYTTSEQLGDAYTTLHQTLKSGKTKSVAWRKWQLKQMFWMIADNEAAVGNVLCLEGLVEHVLEKNLWGGFLSWESATSPSC